MSGRRDLSGYPLPDTNKVSRWFTENGSREVHTKRETRDHEENIRFDVIINTLWSGRRDLNSRPCAPKAHVLAI